MTDAVQSYTGDLYAQTLTYSLGIDTSDVLRCILETDATIDWNCQLYVYCHTFRGCSDLAHVDIAAGDTKRWPPPRRQQQERLMYGRPGGSGGGLATYLGTVVVCSHW